MNNKKRPLRIDHSTLTTHYSLLTTGALLSLIVKTIIFVHQYFSCLNCYSKNSTKKFN